MTSEEISWAMDRVEDAVNNMMGEYVLVKEIEKDTYIYIEVSVGNDKNDLYFHVGISKEVEINKFVDAICQPFVMELYDIDKIPEKLELLDQKFAA